VSGEAVVTAMGAPRRVDKSHGSAVKRTDAAPEDELVQARGRVTRTGVIGVACADEEREVAAEFFQLFKTPVEFYEKGRSYDVVLATVAPPPEALEAKVVVLYGSGAYRVDDDAGLGRAGTSSGALIDAGADRMPLYLGVRTFEDETGVPTAVQEVSVGRTTLVRCGFDLFREVGFLLETGQPATNAHIPTLELHIALLRESIVRGGVPLAEIPPVPAGHDLMVCLTHDVDFLGIRRHRLDRTLAGFIHRALLGSVVELVRGRSSWRRLTRNWLAVAALPLVHLRLVRDPWIPFPRYIELERDLGSTFFLIPFRNRPGERVDARNAEARAVPYDVDDAREWIRTLVDLGFEVAVHGIDAWHSDERGRLERARVAEVTGEDDIGVRIHWLCFDRDSPQRLDAAGFEYDSTCGYNETVGFKAGTTQVFRPMSVRHLLELPLHIEDTALFFRRRLGLDEDAAWGRCQAVWTSTERFGGVLTLLWHERSLVPERQWGEFYERLLQVLRSRRAWFGTARDVVRWFARRRAVEFESAEFRGGILRVALREPVDPETLGLVLRISLPPDSASRGKIRRVEVPWNGRRSIELRVA
jgi:hypothetical protein